MSRHECVSDEPISDAVNKARVSDKRCRNYQNMHDTANICVIGDGQTVIHHLTEHAMLSMY